MPPVSAGRWVVDRSTKQLIAFVVRYRGRLASGVVLSVLTTLVTLVAPWVLKQAIDDLNSGVTDEKLLGYAALTLGLAVLGGALRFCSRHLLNSFSRLVEYDIRNAFYRHLQRLPLSFFHQHRTGDLMSRATSDLSAVRMMVGPALMYASTTGLTFAIALAFMASLNPRLTLIALVPLPLVTLTVRYSGRAIHERFERIQEQLSTMSAVIQEALSGVRVVRAYRQEAMELDRFHDANLEYVERNRALIRLQALFYPSTGLFLGVSALLVLWIGARDVIAGRMSVGELVAFNAYLAMLSWPMIAFGWVTNLLQRGRASWRRMFDVLDMQPAIDDALVREATLAPDAIHGAVELRGLSFAYADTAVLHDISLSVDAGQTVAVIGRTGSGKSTLLSLIARLHDPPPGTVFIDGHDVRTVPLATLRGAIGFVTQEPFLFSDTIAENIAFGGLHLRQGYDGQPAHADLRQGDGEKAAPAIGAEARPLASHRLLRTGRIAEVAAIARLDKDVAQFPQGYETAIGERGITLSGGQKQRTAIARALFIDPKILILDDALSAVDTQTEDEILRRIREARRGRTTLIVSHRISTVRGADRIVVLDAGRSVEQGTHEELIERNGIYAALYRQQQLEEELVEKVPG